MGWNYRRSAKVMPGVRIYMTKKGMGVSLGTRAAHINRSPTGRITRSFGIPGTALSYRETLRSGKSPTGLKTKGSSNLPQPKPSVLRFWRGVLWTFSLLLFIPGLIALFAPAQPGDGSKIGLFIIMIFPMVIMLLLWTTRATRNVRSGSKDVVQSGDAQQSGNSSISEYDLMNSRFFVEPKNLSEFEQTVGDLKELLGLLESVQSSRMDKTIASEFPTKPKEVVLYKAGGFLTDHEGTQALDVGYIYLTNLRVSFMGNSSTSEWQFKNMTIPLSHDDKKVVTFRTTDRKKVSGVKIQSGDWYKFSYYLLCAFGARDQLDLLVDQIRKEIVEYEKLRPPA